MCSVYLFSFDSPASFIFCKINTFLFILISECRLPKQPKNGFYEVVGCTDEDFSSKCLKVPGTIVSQYVVLTYECDPGFAILETIKHAVCFNGSWHPEPPKCQNWVNIICKLIYIYFS